ncbi:MAG: hypothetical protein R6W90_16775 [Ignavibacteriaceae bacterium]
MGQQQLLLIVLGVIVVGIAVVVGINLFTASAESSSQDSLIAQGTSLGALAQQFYRKPEAMAGGGNSFANFTIPNGLTKTADAEWEISTAGDVGGIVFTGYPGTKTDPLYPWTAVITVTPDSIQSRIP